MIFMTGFTLALIILKYNCHESIPGDRLRLDIVVEIVAFLDFRQNGKSGLSAFNTSSDIKFNAAIEHFRYFAH